MSVFVAREVACPRCEVTRSRSVCASLNLDRAPEHAQALRAGAFQRAACGDCGHSFQVEAPMLVMSEPSRIWIHHYPQAWEPRWPELEGAALESWRRNTQAHAPPVARRMFAGAQVRVVFGLAALREKVLLLESGLNDVVVELLKLSRLTKVVPAARPRVVRVAEDALAWAEPGGVREVPRLCIDELLADPIPWQQAWGALDGGPYVDVGRVMGFWGNVSSR